MDMGPPGRPGRAGSCGRAGGLAGSRGVAWRGQQAEGSALLASVRSAFQAFCCFSCGAASCRGPGRATRQQRFGRGFYVNSGEGGRGEHRHWKEEPDAHYRGAQISTWGMPCRFTARGSMGFDRSRPSWRRSFTTVACALRAARNCIVERQVILRQVAIGRTVRPPRAA